MGSMKFSAVCSRPLRRRGA